MGEFFGTDGVRGIANKELTPELAYKLGKAGAYVLSHTGKNRKPLIVIGKDTRISGDMLENALTAGVLAVGGNVIKAGVIPTPGVAYLAKKYEADAGIVISASHNPYEYNGIKFFNGEGFKLDDDVELSIEKLIKEDFKDVELVNYQAIGICKEQEERSLALYKAFLATKMDISLEGMKVVLDCANGASYQVAPEVYDDLGAQVVLIGNEPDGININDSCGSTHVEKLQAKVIEKGADIGLAYDGDADRLIVVDELGQVVDGDKTICICAKLLKEKGLLKNNIVTGTVMSNLGFHKYLESLGIEVNTTKVGDRYVLESMLQTGGIIGGEQSGHIIFLNETTTGDGVLSSLQFIKAVRESGKTVSQLTAEIEIFPQVLVNAKVKNENKNAYESDVQIQGEIKKLEKLMHGNGRVLIRPSGTEALVRVMIEGTDIELIEKLAKDLAEKITKKFN